MTLEVGKYKNAWTGLHLSCVTSAGSLERDAGVASYQTPGRRTNPKITSYAPQTTNPNPMRKDLTCRPGPKPKNKKKPNPQTARAGNQCASQNAVPVASRPRVFLLLPTSPLPGSFNHTPISLPPVDCTPVIRFQAGILIHNAGCQPDWLPFLRMAKTWRNASETEHDQMP